MKKSFLDYFSDATLFLIRPIVLLLMRKEIKVTHKGLTINKNLHEPVILISNHFNTWDTFVIAKNFKTRVRFIATEIAFLDLSKRFGMGLLAQTIKKRVGKSDTNAVRKTFKNLKKGYSIGVFPEGDNTFYGETLDMHQSVGKLIKKANKDVIMFKQQGGYISQPRWADFFSKKGHVHTFGKMLFTKAELEKVSDKEVMEVIEKELYNNDYVFQRKHMYNLDRKKRAEGIERLIYLCNKCNGVVTIKGHEHDIICDKCGVIGTINKFEFIENNQFDNLVDYNRYQYSHIKEVINSEFSFNVTLNLVVKLKNKPIGDFLLTYKNKTITLENKKDKFEFVFDKILYPVNTMRHSFSFDYEGVTYNLTNIRNQFVLYEMLRFTNGSYKN